MSEGPFERLFRQPTSEEMKDHRKKMHTKQQNLENMCKAGLPIIAEIREKMYELVSLGFDSESLTTSREKMALLEEHARGQLHVPPHDCEG
jgi:hypothetical protein